MTDIFKKVMPFLCLAAFFRAAFGSGYMTVEYIFAELENFEISWEPYWSYINDSIARTPVWNPPQVSFDLFAWISYFFNYLASWLNVFWVSFEQGWTNFTYYFNSFFDIIRSIFKLLAVFFVGDETFGSVS